MAAGSGGRSRRSFGPLSPTPSRQTIVDLSRDQAGCLHARLLDAVVGRSGTVYKRWLDAHPELIDGVKEAALDPFRG